MDYRKQLVVYKPLILKILKNFVFQNYPNIEKSDIINGTFDESLLDSITPIEKRASIVAEIKRLILDYLYLTPKTKTHESLHQPQSQILKDIISKFITYNELLSHASNDLTKAQSEVAKILSSSDNSYIVGGWVRDTIIGKKSKDMDFATDIPYDELEQLFLDNGFNVKEAGKEFLVLHVNKYDEYFEVSNFRSDGTYTDGRRPDIVTIGDMYQDGNRRDFTINALYYNCSSFQLMDPTGSGLIDLNANILKFIGNPKDRIKEDYLRIIRFYRFLQKGFVPDQASLSACREHFKSAFAKLTPERVRLELEKMSGLI